jgi:DNA polymerase III epsilon subunit-like protein
MSYIIYVVDTETTGLDPKLNEVVELSMCRFFLDKPEEDETRTWLLKATNPETVEDAALKISGHKREDVLHLSKFGRENYLEPSSLLPEIENWISDDDASVTDRIMAGQNVSFDYDMLEELWKRNNNIDTFPFPTGPNKNLIDTKNIALLIDVCIGKKRDRYNLGSLVKSFGVKKRKAHRAEEDALMTKDLILAQLSPLRQLIKDTFENCYNEDSL